MSAQNGMTETQGPLVILIAGTSHTGKTTLAKRLSEALGWEAISTDSLGRHPGRPWPIVRPPVAEFYGRLEPETIYWFLRVHHDNMWPVIRPLIADRVAMRQSLIFEGAALRPESIAPLLSDAVSGICLHADADLLRERMRGEAGYFEADGPTRALIDKFVERSLHDNTEIRKAAKERGLRLIDVADPAAVEAIFEELVEAAHRSHLD